jgi:hypothetical protein
MCFSGAVVSTLASEVTGSNFGRGTSYRCFTQSLLENVGIVPSVGQDLFNAPMIVIKYLY